MKKLVGWMVEFIVDQMMKIGGPPLSAITLSDGQIALASEIFKFFALLGVCLSTVYFIIELNRKTMFEANDLTMKSFIAPFCKYVISIGVLSQGAKLTSGILGWGNALYEYAFNNWTPSGMDMDTMSAMIEAGGVFEIGGFFFALLMMILLIPMIIVNLIVSLIWIYKAFQFKLEVIYRVCVTPLALSDIYSGQNSNAVRWLKGWIGTVLYGMAFIIIPRLSNFIAIDQLSSMAPMTGAGGLGEVLGKLGYLLLFFIAPFAALGVLGAVKQLTKEALA